MSADATLRIDHVGLCVRDLEAATAFLEAAVGASVLADMVAEGDPVRSGPEVEERFGLAAGAVVSAIRTLRLPDGPTLELLRIGAGDQREPARGSDLGWQHVALLTRDLSASLDRFRRAGGTVLGEPGAAGPGRTSCYARAPFGALVEFVADVPDKGAGPASA